MHTDHYVMKGLYKTCEPQSGSQAVEQCCNGDCLQKAIDEMVLPQMLIGQKS